MKTLLALVVPIFFLMDYIGTIPVFISLTNQYTAKQHIRVAVLASFTACIIVLCFALGGQYIMDYFDLSIPALKVGGGLLLMYIAFEMIFAGQTAYENADKKNIIISPLAIPMLAGPGSMSFAMIAFIELQGSEKMLVPLAIGIVCILGGAALASASVLNRVLGKEFVRGLEKVTAVLLAVIAVEMIMSGVKLYFF